MRLLLPFSLCLALAIVPAASGQPAEIRRAFEEGNRRYAEEDYAAALNSYEQALQEGWASGGLYYNMGGAHYRLGHTGQAVRYYEKARRLLPDNERLQHNLGVIRSQIEGAPPPMPPSFRATLSKRLVALMPPIGYLAVGLLVYVAALAWWVQAGFRAERPVWPGARLAALLATGLLIAGLGLVLSAPPAANRAVALEGPLTLRSAPAAGADSASILPEGSVLRLTERQGDWARVHSAHGDAGWAKIAALGDI